MPRNLAPYRDPLDHLWICTLKKLGFSVRRNAASYVTYDGKGTILIAQTEELDPDDCLAQLLFHEVCHFLTEGERSQYLPDWGLSEMEEQESIVREHACQRLQAALLRPYGLDQLFAPTTGFRTYYDALPEHPLHGDKKDPTIRIAMQGLELARNPPYASILRNALENTSYLHEIMVQAHEGTHLEPSLFEQTRARPKHPIGIPYSASREQTCGACVWYISSSKGPSACRQAQHRYGSSPPVSTKEQACVLFESTPNCQDCSACCRKIYPLVPIKQKEASQLAKELYTSQDSKGLFMKRDPLHKHCIALIGPDPQTMHYRCSVYPDRPQVCRDIVPGSRGCLFARYRMGLSI